MRFRASPPCDEHHRGSQRRSLAGAGRSGLVLRLSGRESASRTDSTPEHRGASLSQSVRVAAKPGSRSKALSRWPIADVGASSRPGLVDGVAKGLAGLERGRWRGGDRDRLAGTRGLCPLRAGRTPVPKVPKPAMETGSSFARLSPMAAKTAQSMRSAVALVSESSAARRAPSLALFMSSSPVMARRDIPRSTRTAPASQGGVFGRTAQRASGRQRRASVSLGMELSEECNAVWGVNRLMRNGRGAVRMPPGPALRRSNASAVTDPRRSAPDRGGTTAVADRERGAAHEPERESWG